MSASKRSLAALAAMLGLVFATVAFAAPGGAQPYSNAPTLSVSSANPCVGARVKLTGTAFVPGSTVRITLNSKTYQLGSVTVEAGGTFSKTVTLPKGLTGTHTFTARGHATKDNKNTATVSVKIGCTSGVGGVSAGGANPAGGADPVSSGTGGLATTGVAVIGIGALGVAFLVAGFGLMLSARRRRATA